MLASLTVLPLSGILSGVIILVTPVQLVGVVLYCYGVVASRHSVLANGEVQRR